MEELAQLSIIIGLTGIMVTVIGWSIGDMVINVLRNKLCVGKKLWQIRRKV
jgi:hypothetical protein